MIMCVCLFGHSAVVFHEFNVFLCVLLTLCAAVFSGDILLIYSAVKLPASLFNKITYVVREVCGSTALQAFHNAQRKMSAGCKSRR